MGAMTVDGTVVEVHSRWVGDHDRIITEATVRTTTGDVVVSQIGGSAEGFGMRQFPSPPLLAMGMQVALTAHDGTDLSGTTHIAVDAVRVLADPEGFVRTGPTAAGHYLYWESGCVFVTVDSAGTKDLPGDTEFPLIDDCIATWNEGVAGCSYIKIVKEATEPAEVGRDMKNVIKFRDDSWCRPKIGNDMMRCYADSAAGITTATYVDDMNSDRDGAIVDADVEINGKNFTITNDGMTLGDPNGIQSDLRNTLTHELGHLLGLEHTCLAMGDPPRFDGTGAPVPSCSMASSPDITEATMYPFQDSGETKKRTLEADDIAGICSVYPTADDPGTCSKPGDGGGCCSTTAEAPSGAVLLLGAFGLFSLARPRRRRRY
ncbi:MAG TPA: hypothetical protein VGM90_34545 [Kofleriaceae bacterium]|jgi:hypothetical protein